MGTETSKASEELVGSSFHEESRQGSQIPYFERLNIKHNPLPPSQSNIVKLFDTDNTSRVSKPKAFII